MARNIRLEFELESLKRGEPSYYQLLGLDEFERDERKIAEAARKTLERAKKWDRAQSARIIGRVLQAKNTLTNPEEKAEYDAQLKRFRATQPLTEKPAVAEDGDAIDQLRRRAEQHQIEVQSEEPRSPLLAILFIIALAIFCIGFVLYRYRALRRSREGQLQAFETAVVALEEGREPEAVEQLQALSEKAEWASLATRAGELSAMIKSQRERQERIESLLEQAAALPHEAAIEPTVELYGLLKQVGTVDPTIEKRVKVESIRIATEPAGARIVVASEEPAASPVAFVGRLMPFQGEIGIFAEGYEPLVVPVQVLPRGTYELDVEMFRYEDLISEWRMPAVGTETFRLPLRPEEGTVAAKNPELLTLKQHEDAPRKVTLTGRGKPGRTALIFRYKGRPLSIPVTLREVHRKEVHPPQALVAVPRRGRVYVGFDANPENRNITLFKYLVFRKVDAEGAEWEEIGSVSAPAGPQRTVDRVIPKELLEAPGAGEIPKRMFWHKDNTVTAAEDYFYGVKAVAVDAAVEKPTSPMSKPIEASPLYEVDFALRGIPGGRAGFEVIRWAGDSRWTSQTFFVKPGEMIGERQTVRQRIIDYRTGYKLVSVDPSATNIIANRRVRGKATVEGPDGKEVVMWRGSFLHPASEKIKQEMGRKPRTGPVEPEKGEPKDEKTPDVEVLQPD